MTLFLVIGIFWFFSVIVRQFLTIAWVNRQVISILEVQKNGDK